MLGYLDFLFLSYEGRIGRLTFWVSTFVLAVMQVGVFFWLGWAARDILAAAHNNPAMQGQVVTHFIVPSLLFLGIFLWPTYAIYAKRWHDRDKSGWWSLVGFVPVIGGLWMMLELGLFGGSDGSNTYGSR